jgi:hypothetical protein
MSSNKNIMFRFTIGSADNQTLKFWDQYAPSFDERMESLIYAHKAGFQTSIGSVAGTDETRIFFYGQNKLAQVEANSLYRMCMEARGWSAIEPK